jgi:acyl carrier protein
VQTNIVVNLPEDPALRETLKRCTPATYYAACKFRATGDTDALRTLIGGVVERFVDRDLRANLAGPLESQPALRLREDLGLDSLTMMEVVMLAEEVLPLSITNEELNRLQNLGHVHEFIVAKLAEAGRCPGTEAAACSQAAGIEAGEKTSRTEPATVTVPDQALPRFETKDIIRRPGNPEKNPDCCLATN